MGLLTKEDKQLMLEEIRHHGNEMLTHLYEIEILILQLGDSGTRARMEAYWLPSIKGALGSTNHPNTIMISLGDTIEEIEDELRGKDLEEE